MRILVVEDDSLLAAGLTRLLTRAGHGVDQMKSGVQADSALRATPYELLVLDIGLPDIDGFEVLRRLRQRRSQTNVLVLTARDAVEDRVRGLDLGADDYLTKPFSLTEFEARVRALLRRTSLPSGPIVVGGLTIDMEAKRVTANGASVELTVREWALLELFLTRPGACSARTTSRSSCSTTTSTWRSIRSRSTFRACAPRSKRRACASARCAASVTCGSRSMADARVEWTSIRRRLLLFLIPSLLFLVLCAGVLTYGVALSVATSAYDRSLLDPALDMAENIRVGADGPHLDMLMQAQEALMYDHVDSMVFQIRAADGRVIAGTEELAAAPAIERWRAQVFRRRLSSTNRYASQRCADTGFYVQVGETLSKRRP